MAKFLDSKTVHGKVSISTGRDAMNFPIWGTARKSTMFMEEKSTLELSVKIFRPSRRRTNDHAFNLKARNAASLISFHKQAFTDTQTGIVHSVRIFYIKYETNSGDVELTFEFERSDPEYEKKAVDLKEFLHRMAAAGTIGNVIENDHAPGSN